MTPPSASGLSGMSKKVFRGCRSDQDAGASRLFPPTGQSLERVGYQVSELLHHSPRLCGLDRSC